MLAFDLRSRCLNIIYSTLDGYEGYRTRKLHVAESGRIPESDGKVTTHEILLRARSTRMHSSERRARSKILKAALSTARVSWKRMSTPSERSTLDEISETRGDRVLDGSWSRCCFRCVLPRARASELPRTGSAL